MSIELHTHDAVIVGGGLAGLSAGIYLGRSMRDALIVDHETSMARWEPDVQNYLGFPKGIAGKDLLQRGREQAERYDVQFAEDEILDASVCKHGFELHGRKASYLGKKLLLATGIFHIPPDIPGVKRCLGHSVFFCKDCDGYRVQDKKIAIYGSNNEAVRYALNMLLFSPVVVVVTDSHRVHWDRRNAKWLKEYEIPVFRQRIIRVDHKNRQIESITFEDQTCVEIDVIFTTRGDIYYNKLARSLGAKVSKDGEVLVDADQRTSVEGAYAAGCVTPANCQLIIAAGQGATAAQAINRDLLEDELAHHRLRRLRQAQLETAPTRPPVTVDTR